MTETDATNRPFQMPEKFTPYLEKHRIYKLFKDMIQDLIITLPKDHLKHMKIYLGRRLHNAKDADRVIMLISPDLDIDVNSIVKDLIKNLGSFVITRRCVMDRYEESDNYVPGCISPILMAEATKAMTLKNTVFQTGWLMFDHPCSLREARCLQQEGVLPTVTLFLTPPPPLAPPTDNPHTAARGFFEQDIEGLKFAYKATLKAEHVSCTLWKIGGVYLVLLIVVGKWRVADGCFSEVQVSSEDDTKVIATKCVNAIRAYAAGAQGPGQSLQVWGAPGVYRVLLLGPRGSGRRSQAAALANRFGLVYLHFDDLYNEARERDDEVGEKLRNYGCSTQLRAEIVERRLAHKDCIDNGWVLVGYPMSGADFENLEYMPTPPNRVIFLNTDWATCKEREIARGIDWCTGKEMPLGSGPRVMQHPRNDEIQLDNELDTYFSETLAELRAAAGFTAVEVDSLKPLDQVQTEVQAAVMAMPAYNIEFGSHLSNVCAE